MRYPAKFLSRKSSGQAVLLVILGMAVVLTIVLSVVSRSVTDVSVTKVEEDSSKAFSAAEAGIEKLLIGGSSSISNFDLGNQASIELAQTSALGEGERFFSFDETYKSGDIGTIWFVSHDSNDPSKLAPCSAASPCFNGDIENICWNGTDEEAPAVELSFYYDTGGGFSVGDFSGVKVKRLAFDPVANRSVGFGAISQPPADDQDLNSYRFCTGSIPRSVIGGGSGQPLFARVKFLYNTATGYNFGIKVSNGTLPSQGRQLESKGTAGSAARKIVVNDYYRAPLGIFEAGIFSQGDLTKN